MQNFHLHCTSRIALAFTTSLNPFSAEHQYFPDWFLFASKLSVSPWPIVVPSFSQVIFGVGFPVAEQLNVTVLDSITVWFVGFVIKLGATANYRILNWYLWNTIKFVQNPWNPFQKNPLSLFLSLEVIFSAKSTWKRVNLLGTKKNLFLTCMS